MARHVILFLTYLLTRGVLPTPDSDENYDSRGRPEPTGPQGDTGSTGPTGPTGATGPPGDRGEKGDQGPPGYTGSTGREGRTGHPGPHGPRGDRGDKGDKGDAGHNGYPGKPGQDGTNGEIGATGPPGAPGLNGLDGTQGRVGPSGPPGRDGPPGYPGRDGAPGPSGGPVGRPGHDGSPGATGPQGQPGPAGPQGLQGNIPEQYRLMVMVSLALHAVSLVLIAVLVVCVIVLRHHNNKTRSMAGKRHHSNDTGSALSLISGGATSDVRKRQLYQQLSNDLRAHMMAENAYAVLPPLADRHSYERMGSERSASTSTSLGYLYPIISGVSSPTAPGPSKISLEEEGGTDTDSVSYAGRSYVRRPSDVTIKTDVTDGRSGVSYLELLADNEAGP